MDTPNWEHPRLDDTLELDSNQLRRGLTGRGGLTSPLTVDEAFMQYIPDSTPIQGTPPPWSADLYTGGLDKLRSFAEGSNVGGTEEKEQERGEEESTMETSKGSIRGSLISSRPSNPPIPKVPPLPQTLSTRTVSRSRSGSNVLVIPPVPQLKRAVTMRSVSSRSSMAEGSRPKSSHSDADLTEREIYPRTSGSELGSNLGRFDVTRRRATDTAPAPPSRMRALSKSSMRKLSSSSRSATPIGDGGQNNSGPRAEVWESTFQGAENADVGLVRPRAPTPSAMPPTMSEANLPPSPYSTPSINPQFQPVPQSQLAARPSTHARSTSAGRSRSRSVSAGPPGTPPLPPQAPPTLPMSVPDDYIAEPYPLSPTTPPRPFARLPKSASSAYVDPTGFPAPPSYPPVPSLVASGSASTSTRSSAYTSPGASHILSSSDLSALGIGLGRVVKHEDETHVLYGEDDVLDMSGGPNTEKHLPNPIPYASRDNSESAIARLQFATNAAALSAGNRSPGNIIHGWNEPYASSAQNYEDSPSPLSRTDPPKKMVNTVWRSVNEDGDFEPDMDPDDAEPLPAATSSFSYQRPRNGTVASSSSASVITSASEDETDADDYAFLKEVNELDEDARTAAVVVAEEGRGLIVHGEGMDISSVNIQPGTTHLLLSSSSSPHSIPSLLTQTLPNISTTVLALDISANFLSALPPSLAACTQLTELNIANNPLRALPVWLSGLEKLHVLIADSTGISSLPSELASLKALTILSIRRNKLMSLPPWLSYLPVLERLEVEGNPFQGPWKALLAPLISARQPTPSISGSVQQQPSISSSSSHSDLNSVYGPGLSMYGESISSNPPITPSSANMQVPLSYAHSQSSFTSKLDGEPYPMSPAAESAANGARKLLTEEEDHTIMPSRLVGQTLKTSTPLPSTPNQLSVPPLSPGPPTGASTKSFASSISSVSQLPYISGSPTSSMPEDRQEGSSLQRAPTFSAVDRRTPSPYLRPLSRTRTTPSRSRMSAGSANGSIATFIAEQGHGGMRSRTSSAASQRPHTDYVSGRYDKSSGVEDSGYYGSVTEYSAFRNSDGSEWLSFDAVQEDERKKELRRMRSADELRRALESVIGPSEPLAPPEEDDNGGETTETDRRPGFHVPDVPRIDMRPGMKQNYTAADAETVSPSRAVALQDRPVAKRFASLGANAGFGAQATHVRPPLSESMWDAGVDADAEPDHDEARKSRAASPTLQDEEVRRPKTSRKWGFLKKMSMGRMRPEPTVPKFAAPSSRSTQTSPQGSTSKRIGIPPSSVANGASPTPKPRQPSRERSLVNASPSVSLVPSHLTPSTGHGPSSSLAVPAHVRAARRRSFLPLDGPPALNIPIPRTSPFMPEALIPTEAEEELQSAITDTSRSPESPLPPIPVSSLDSPGEYYNPNSRALRSVMAYLRDMADLGMANSAIPPLLPTATASSSNLAQHENTETRSRRPTIVESGRVLSEASLTSSSSSGPTTTNSSLRSDEQRANTMSVATSESGGSGKGDEERKYKDDKSKRTLLMKEIIETERTYVQGLQELLDIYIKPASQPVNTLGNAVASTKETVIPAQERKIVFNGVDALFSFHNQVFLPALEQAARPLLLSRPDADTSGELSTTVAEAVAMAFVSHAAFMRMYSTYINNFDNAIQRLKHWSHDQRKPGVLSPSSSTAHLAGMVLQQMAVAGAPTSSEAVPTSGVQSLTSSQRKRIKQFLKRSRLNPKHSQINLEAYLLLPVQRIPRYRLLLEELVRCTPRIPRNPELFDDPLDRALNEIQSLANTMNEGKREAESRKRLVQWQSRIKGKFPSPLVQPHRRLIMDGMLKLTKVVRKSSVFFDVINSDGDKTNVQVECLAPEENPRSLVGVLCNDLLVLCKDPSNGQDKHGPVDLWAVLRMQTLAQPASIIPGGTLRIVDNKAILYFTTPSTSEALTWCRAINMHIPVSTT